MKALLLALLFGVGLATVSLADEADEIDAELESGTNAYPYLLMGVEHVDESWSNNAAIGCEITSGHIYINPRFVIHDFWRSGAADSTDPVPWDQTVEVSLGVFKSDYSILGLQTSPYAGIGVARPVGPDQFSVGLEGGLEFSFSKFFGDVGIKVRDIFTDDKEEVYPWDTSVGVGVGIYFGGDEEEKGRS